MVRRRRMTGRYSRRLKTVKYSNETYNFGSLVTVTGAATRSMTLIAPIQAQGTRKVKNMEVQIISSPWRLNDNSELGDPLVWCLVYVPEGTNPSNITLGTAEKPASLYEPNQNVILSGVVPSNIRTPYKVKTRLARNLNSGDRICLCICNPMGNPQVQTTCNFCMTVNYAISF